MDDIKEWLASAMDYAQGVHLYEMYGSNGTLKRLFAAGKNAYNSDKLRSELRRILEDFKPLEQAAQAPAKRSARSTERIENPTEEVKALEKSWRSKYAEMAFLHGKLDNCLESERGTMALRILSLDKEINDIMDSLAYFKEHGKLPAPPPDALEELRTLDRAILEKMRRNLIANISHARAGRRCADNLQSMIDRKDFITNILER